MLVDEADACGWGRCLWMRHVKDVYMMLVDEALYIIVNMHVDGADACGWGRVKMSVDEADACE